MFDTSTVQFSAPDRPRSGAFASDDNASVDRPVVSRALIVEDEILVAWHLESLLEDLKLEVLGIVSNGSDALEKAASHDVDLIFMDVNLHGDLDGIEIAERILARRKVPILFVTAYADEPVISRIRSLLPDAPVISKPATAAAITSAIRKIHAANPS
jgi:CheY-like chemotaxis protein